MDSCVNDLLLMHTLSIYRVAKGDLVIMVSLDHVELG